MKMNALKKVVGKKNRAIPKLGAKAVAKKMSTGMRKMLSPKVY